MTEFVILVNENDQQVGLMEKLEAHQKGLLHRAVSVFIFNTKGEMLLQRRADCKYHSAGLWSNTCCSHPRNEEENLAAAVRRLQEEMGMKVELEYLFPFLYKAEFDNDLIEHELDHIFIATSDAAPILNPEEVSEYRYIGLAELNEEIKKNPDQFTAWFKMLVEPVVKNRVQ